MSIPNAVKDTDHPIERLRASELVKYDLSYFNNEYWKEDIPGRSGNGGRSYNDPHHAKRFDMLGSAVNRHVVFDSLLDVGCGPGLFLRALAGGSGRLAGVDGAAAAIELAGKEGLGCGGLTGRAELALAACTDLPYGDGTFDVVTCFDVLEHLVVFDVAAAIAEMARVCRRELVMSINTDNPYAFHPTILSPDTWRALFAGQPSLVPNPNLEAALAAEVGSRRDEYAFYCYNVAT